MREVVAGPKKGGQEAQALIDSRSKELVVAGSEIRRVGLEYCLDTLKNNEGTNKFKKLNQLKEILGNAENGNEVFSNVTK